MDIACIMNNRSHMDFTTIVGLVASIFTATSLLPQLFKIIKEKKTEGVSLWMMLVLCTGLGCWVYYGFLQEDWIIIGSNFFSLLVTLSTGILTIIYKPKSGN